MGSKQGSRPKKKGGKAETTKPDIVKRKTKIPVRVKLSPEEEIRIGHELADAHALVAAIKAQKESTMSDFRKREKAAAEKIGQLSMSLTRGDDERLTECEVLFDYREGTVTITRCDNQERIGQRAMTTDERQRELPLDEGEAAA